MVRDHLADGLHAVDRLDLVAVGLADLHLVDHLDLPADPAGLPS